MSLTIKTNNQYRLALYGYELPLEIQKDFDYVADLESETFLLYKGCYYWIGDFMLCTHPDFKNWDGYSSDSFFSGILIKVDPYDNDRYLMATFCY